jgi:hypothetical protein
MTIGIPPRKEEPDPPRWQGCAFPIIIVIGAALTGLAIEFIATLVSRLS